MEKASTARHSYSAVVRHCLRKHEMTLPASRSDSDEDGHSSVAGRPCLPFVSPMLLGRCQPLPAADGEQVFHLTQPGHHLQVSCCQQPQSNRH